MSSNPSPSASHPHPLTNKANLTNMSAIAASSGFDVLQFQSFNSAVDVAFWYELGKQKLDFYQLNTKPQEILAGYTNALNHHIPAQLALGDYSFRPWDSSAEAIASLPAFHVPARGILHIANTLEQFVHFNTSALLERLRDEIWDSIKSGAALENPARHLNRFLLLAYADLKNHKYYYWFAIPAVLHPAIRISSLPPYPIQNYFATDQQLALIKSFCIFAQHNCSESDRKSNILRPESYFLVVKRHVGLASVEPLNRYEEIKRSLSLSDEILLGFVDPCPLATNPGWPLRNLLLLAAVYFKLSSVNVLCFRDVLSAQQLLDGKKYIYLTSFVLSIKFSTAGAEEQAKGQISPKEANHSSGGQSELVGAPLNFSSLTSTVPRVVGWERNKSGKLAPRSMDVAALMDPARLAEQSAELNLKLMRWRQVPSLDLAAIASSKCLLLGAGTLGCNVARSLLSWGVKQITLVDNGKVSYSNPVRQSLFQFEDCVAGKPKAQAAAEALKAIFPKVSARGVSLTIPMPGHVVSDSEMSEVRREIEQLTELVKKHDAIFLLTDSRESRWFPTVLCSVHKKICINAALGFDTFVVMRHGENYSTPTEEEKMDEEEYEEEEEEEDDEAQTEETRRSFNLLEFDMNAPAPQATPPTEEILNFSKPTSAAASSSSDSSDSDDSSSSSSDSDDSSLTDAERKARRKTRRKEKKAAKKQRRKERKARKATKKAAAEAAAAAEANKKKTKRRKKKKIVAKVEGGDILNSASSQYAAAAASSALASPNLGCYFCSDVVAPTDSLRDRSLDQQCTVTRPGLSLIAASLAVELFVSILQHPLKQRAPVNVTDVDANNGLGFLPHQIRGFLPRFQMNNVVGQQFEHCTACSSRVLYQWESRGLDFLFEALNRPPQFLEDLSGLTAMKKATEEILASAEYSVEDDEFEWAEVENAEKKKENPLDFVFSAVTPAQPIESPLDQLNLASLVIPPSSPSPPPPAVVAPVVPKSRATNAFDDLLGPEITK